jgi:MFS family permease
MQVLRSRNSQLFFGGQGISLIGTWMTHTATLWLVYQLTGSPLFLGLVGFTDRIPSFFLAPITGVLVERWNRHRILLVTQTLSMVHAFTLAALTLSETININYILVLSLFIGVVNAFDITARQVFIAEVVDRRENLSQAIGLNASIISSARLLGPAIAGILIGVFNLGFCFAIDGISYIAVIVALLAIKTEWKPITKLSPNIWKSFEEGLIYAFNHPPIRAILLLLALVSFLGTPYISLAPVFAQEVMHGNSETLGFLLAFAGVGSLIGSIYLSRQKSLIKLEKFWKYSTVFVGIGLIGFSQSQHLWLSFLMTFIIGFCLVIQVATSNALLHAIVDDDKRSRIMSLFTLAYIGIAPFGNLFIGEAAMKLGAPSTLTINGLFCILGVFIVRKQMGHLGLFKDRKR